MEINPTIAAVVAAILAFIGGLFTKRSSTTTDSDATSQDSHVDINKLVDQIVVGLNAKIEQLEMRVNQLERIEHDLQDEVDDRDQRIADLEERVDKLEAWIKAQGVDPEHIIRST